MNLKYIKRIAIKLAFLAIPVLISVQSSAQTKEGEVVEKISEAIKGTEKSPIKPYKEIITKDAVSDTGLFTVHQVNGVFYFEIPDSLLKREMLIVSRRAAMSGSELDNMVAGERANDALMVKWEKTPDSKNIVLKKVTTRNIMQYHGNDSSFREAIELQTLDPILISFPIKTLGHDSYVIDVADLYLEDIKELTPFSSGGLLEALGVVAPKKYTFHKNRSYIAETNSFKDNIEVRSMLTFTEIEKTGQKVFSILMHRSMVLLPEQPMQPRFADERIGHFTQKYTEYDENKPVSENYIIKRWRLEPKEEDLAAFKRGELVEPKEKIVFYIDRTTPEKWKKYIVQGVKDWLPAFEEAGFKDAIEVLDAPSNDPDFHPEDVRYSVIRYTASNIPNAKGPSVIDPRSGEILESDVIVYHNIIKLIREWRFAQTAANDPKVRTVNIADSIIGGGLRYVIAHEIGHSLGLRHNMAASAAFPVDSLRSSSFTQKYGTTPSIMDYARFNYVAQPGDENVRLTPPNLGIYDKYAIKWAYKPILGADKYEEQKVLNSWIEEHADDPKYRFGEGDLQGSDPSSMREDLGDDVIKASEYGVKNAQYIMEYMNEWLYDSGAKYDDMEDYYSGVLKQYGRYLKHAGTLVGGTYLRRPVQGQNEVAYRYVPKEKQREAVHFLLKQYRELPIWIENDALKAKLNIIESAGFVRRIVTPPSYLERLFKSSFKANIANDGKLMMMIEDEISNGDSVYTASEFLKDIRNDIFKETIEKKELGYYGQLMQNVYVDWLLSGSHFNPIIPFKPSALKEVNSDQQLRSSSDVDCGFDSFLDLSTENSLHFQFVNIVRNNKQDKITSLILAEVKDIKKILLKKGKSSDEQTRAHYDYLLKKINLYLIP